jgi:Tol biopolymer transport system component
VWSPHSEILLTIDMVDIDGQVLPRLFCYDVRKQELTPLFSEINIDESRPAWSPDGEWIAITRSEWGGDPQNRGNQIWMARPDGSGAHPITNDKGLYHGQPFWSPDGNYLVYEVISSAIDQKFQGVHLLDIETGEITVLSSLGNAPRWLP